MTLESYPLKVMTLEEAIQAQFRLVDCFSRHFPGGQSLTQGDLGVVEPYGRPATTTKVEQVLAEFFEAEDAALVRGSGTGAIRSAFFAAFAPGSKVIFHDAHIYHTTRVTVQAMGIQPVYYDFNQLQSWPQKPASDIAGAFLQHSRQQLSDSYELEAVIRHLRQTLGDLPIILDDNYAVLKTPRIGVQLGADLSTFSTFKLLGPEGVGAVIGRASLINTIRDHNRSGGCQVQGHEAVDVLRGMVFLPVSAAIQYQVACEVAQRLSNGEIPGVAGAVVANFEETDVLVELEQPIAKAVILNAAQLGAASHPVGAESRYEITPMFYRVSKSALAAHPEWADTMVRINPLRAGAEQIMGILSQAILKTSEGR